MPGSQHGPSIKNPKVYEALRRKRGMSKERAARISNAMVKKESAASPAAIPPTGYSATFNQPGIESRRAKLRRRKMQVATKAPNYGARAGQTIAGALGRANDGKFTRAGSAQPAKQPKGKPSKAPKKPSAERDAEREAKRNATQAQRAAEQAAARDAAYRKLNIAPDGQKALEALRMGESADADAIKRAGLEDAGLVEQDSEGKYHLTPSGRATVNAASRGDSGRAGDTIASARDRLRARRERIAARDQKKRNRLTNSTKQTDSERAMFAKMGGGGGGGGGGAAGGGGGTSTLWPKGPDGKRTPQAAAAETRASEGSGASTADAAKRDQELDRVSTAAPLNAPNTIPTAVPVRRFTDAKEGDAYLKQRMAVKNLSSTEKDALEYYQGGNYEVVNGALRGTLPFTMTADERAVVNKKIDGLNKVMERSHTLDNLEVHRGMFVSKGETSSWELVESWQTGAVMRDPGFISTTIDTKVSRRFSTSDSPYDPGPGAKAVDVRIRVPAGTPAVYYNSVLPRGNAEERELLLGSNLTYRVVGRVDNPNGKTTIDIEIVP